PAARRALRQDRRPGVRPGRLGAPGRRPGSHPPPGGSSLPAPRRPAGELPALAPAGRRVILATTNGTLAAELVRECGVEHVLIGCMRNGDAVMRSAVALARRLDRSISLVCAGREGSLIPALDDAYCAAALLRQGEALVRAAGATVSL